MKQILVYSIITIPTLLSSFILGRYIFPAEYNKVIIYSPISIPFVEKKSSDKPITVVEFSDLECPHSVTAHARLQKVLRKKKYSGKIEYVFKSFHLETRKIAPALTKAVLAAGKQKKADEMREMLFDFLKKNMKKVDIKDTQIINQFAVELNLNKEQFIHDIESENISRQYEADISNAKELHITGVPMVFINGHPLKGTQSIETYEAVIDKLL